MVILCLVKRKSGYEMFPVKMDGKNKIVILCHNRGNVKLYKIYIYNT